MSNAIRLHYSAVAKRLLPTTFSSVSDTSRHILSGCSRKWSSRSFASFTSVNRTQYQNGCNIFNSIAPKHKLQMLSKMAGVELTKIPLVRQFGFSVPLAFDAITNSRNSNTNDQIGQICFLNIDNKHIHKSIVSQSYCVTSRKYSTVDKPTSTPTKSPSLADEIMQTKMKEPSQTNEGQPETANKDDPSKAPGSDKWRKIGYVAFMISMGGALVVNGVLFCEYYYSRLSISINLISKLLFNLNSSANVSIFNSALPDRDEEGNDLKDEFTDLPFPSQVRFLFIP